MKTSGWGGGTQAAGEYELFRNMNLVFMQMVVLMKTKEKKHSHNNFAYRADDSLSKEKGFQSSS